MTVFTAIVLVALSRLLPHPPNFTCVGAIALFAGFMSHGRYGERLGLAVPLLAMLASDVLGHLLDVPGMGFYSPSAMLMVYGAFLGVAMLGRVAAGGLREGDRPWKMGLHIGAASLAGSTLFFLISNFGVYVQGAYGWGLSGLGRCYVSALPFFGNTVGGDLFFAVLLFGSAALVGKLHGTGATLTEAVARAKIDG